MTANRKLRNSRREKVSSRTDDEHPPPQPPRPPRDETRVEIDSNPYMNNDNDAPPSYEDAMAELISPIEGPRGEYHQPPPTLERNISDPIGDTKAPITDRDEYAHSDIEDMHDNNLTHSFSRDSSESIDMLPQSPRLRPLSVAESVFDESGTKPGQNNNIITNERYPQRPLSSSSLSTSTPQASSRQRVPSTGMPNRRPVPNSTQSQGNAS